MRKAEVKMKGKLAGYIWQNEYGYHFQYSKKYVESNDAEAISKTFPIQIEPFLSNTIFSFFDGLIPEGWLLELAEKNWKLNPGDRLALLFATCSDCIGAVSIHPISTSDE